MNIMKRLKLYVQCLIITVFVACYAFMNSALAYRSNSLYYIGKWNGVLSIYYKDSDGTSTRNICRCDVTAKITKDKKATLKLFNPRSSFGGDSTTDCINSLKTGLCDGKTFTSKIIPDDKQDCINVPINHNDSALSAQLPLCITVSNTLWGATSTVNGTLEYMMLVHKK